MANLVNGIQFAKFSLPITIYKYGGITDRLPADSPKFSSPIASISSNDSPKISPSKIFPRTVVYIV